MHVEFVVIIKPNGKSSNNTVTDFERITKLLQTLLYAKSNETQYSNIKHGQ